jgi:hypothetical protein
MTEQRHRDKSINMYMQRKVLHRILYPRCTLMDLKKKKQKQKPWQKHKKKRDRIQH